MIASRLSILYTSSTMCSLYTAMSFISPRSPFLHNYNTYAGKWVGNEINL